MSSRLPSALGFALWAASALAILVLVAWCLALPGRTPPAFPEGDPAVLELYTWQASHGFWEYGPYSRFGWHHPGPIYFYLLAPFYIASQHHTMALDAGALAINLVALAIVGWGLTRFLERRVAVLVLVSLAWYAFHIARLLTSTWNPHVLLLPLVGLVVTGSMVLAGRLAWLPLLVAIGSFIAQTHVGLVPCVAAMCACAAIGGWLRANSARGSESASESKRGTANLKRRFTALIGGGRGRRAALAAGARRAVHRGRWRQPHRHRPLLRPIRPDRGHRVISRGADGLG